MLIRSENENDLKAVHSLNASAFGTEAEADLVDELRNKTHPFISLVAEYNNEVVGHILLTPVSLSDYTEIKIMGLAPMAVAPQHQKKGVGSKLIHAGLEHCKKLKFGAIVVLGHSEYYPRFGFLPSSFFGISCEFKVPEEAFMVIELQSGYLRGKVGIIKYHEEFKNV